MYTHIYTYIHLYIYIYIYICIHSLSFPLPTWAVDSFLPNYIMKVGLWKCKFSLVR